MSHVARQGAARCLSLLQPRYCASQAGPTPTPASASDALETLLQSKFNANPTATAKAVAASLTSSQRSALVSQLQQAASQEAAAKAATDLCSRGDVQRAFLDQKVVDTATATCSPPFRSLAVIAIIRGLPFVGFGFLDNAIMIVAGEEIDAVFGAKLGLSTMAAAGLGNLFADVAGISFANSIEQALRRLSWMRDPPMSKAQASMGSVRGAKYLGAALGVMIGCTLGLTPLLWMGHKRKEPATVEGVVAA